MGSCLTSSKRSKANAEENSNLAPSSTSTSNYKSNEQRITDKASKESEQDIPVVDSSGVAVVNVGNDEDYDDESELPTIVSASAVMGEGIVVEGIDPDAAAKQEALLAKFDSVRGKKKSTSHGAGMHAWSKARHERRQNRRKIK